MVKTFCYSADDCSAAPAVPPDRHGRHHGTHPYDFVGDVVAGTKCPDDHPYDRKWKCCCAKWASTGGLPSSCEAAATPSGPGGFDYTKRCSKPAADEHDCSDTYTDKLSNFDAEPNRKAWEVCCDHYLMIPHGADPPPERCQGADYDPGGFPPDQPMGQ